MSTKNITNRIKNLSPKKTKPIQQKLETIVDQSGNTLINTKVKNEKQETRPNCPQSNSIETPQHQEENFQNE